MKCKGYIKFAVLPILTCVLLCLFVVKIQAAEVKEIELEHEKSIKKYDITGDGKKDTIKIHCDDKEPYIDGGDRRYGCDWKIYVNGKVVYKCKKNYVHLDVRLYQVSKKRVYWWIRLGIMTNGDIEGSSLYQLKKGKLKKVCDFYNPIVKSIPCYHYRAWIENITSKKIVVRCANQFSATGGISWNMIYEYKKGKWKRKGNTYKVDYSGVYCNNSWTANIEIKVFKLPGSKKRVFTIKKGEKVKIEKICLKNKKVYFQVKNKKGKKGWFIDPDDFSTTYFEETVFSA